MKSSVLAAAFLLSLAAAAPALACAGSVAARADNVFDSVLDLKATRCAQIGAIVTGGGHYTEGRSSGYGVRTVIRAEGEDTNTSVDSRGRDLHTGVLVQDGGEAHIRSRGFDVGIAARAANGASISANAEGHGITMRLEAR